MSIQMNRILDVVASFAIVVLGLSLAVLVGSTVIIGYGNYLATLTH